MVNLEYFSLSTATLTVVTRRGKRRREIKDQRRSEIKDQRTKGRMRAEMSENRWWMKRLTRQRKKRRRKEWREK